MRRMLLVGMTVAATCGVVTPADAVVRSGPADLSVVGHPAGDAQVGADANGSVLAAWARFNGSDRVVQSATRPRGEAWTEPVTVSGSGADAADPHLAVARSGNSALVWHRLDPTGTIAQASYVLRGGVWEPPFSLSAPGRDAHGVTVALDAADGATALWLTFDGQRQVVEARHRAPDGTWDAIQQVSGPGLNAYDASVAAGPAGTATAVWQRSDGAYTRIESSSRASDGTWSAPVRLSAPARHASAPRVAVGADGTTVVAWQRFNGVNTIVQATRRDPGGSWPAASDLSRAGLSAHSPSLAVDATGASLVAWVDVRGVYAAYAGVPPRDRRAWYAPHEVALIARTPHVAAAGAGAFAVTYAVHDSVQGAVRLNNTAWHHEELSDYAVQSFYPRIAIAGDSYVAVWQRLGLGGLGDVIQTATFDRTVAPEEDMDEDEDEEIAEDGEETDAAAQADASLRVGTARVVGSRVVVRLACGRCSGTLAVRSLLPGRAARTGGLISVARFRATRGVAIVHLRLSPRLVSLLTRFEQLPVELRVGAHARRVVLRR